MKIRVGNAKKADDICSRGLDGVLLIAGDEDVRIRVTEKAGGFVIHSTVDKGKTWSQWQKIGGSGD